MRRTLLKYTFLTWISLFFSSIRASGPVKKVTKIKIPENKDVNSYYKELPEYINITAAYHALGSFVSTGGLLDFNITNDTINNQITYEIIFLNKNYLQLYERTVEPASQLKEEIRNKLGYVTSISVIS